MDCLGSPTVNNVVGEFPVIILSISIWIPSVSWNSSTSICLYDCEIFRQSFTLVLNNFHVSIRRSSLSRHEPDNFFQENVFQEAWIPSSKAMPLVLSHPFHSHKTMKLIEETLQRVCLFCSRVPRSSPSLILSRIYFNVYYCCLLKYWFTILI